MDQAITNRSNGEAMTTGPINTDHPNRKNCSNIVIKAIASGLIIKPAMCTICGAEERVVGHHHDYSRPLDVVWMCHPCHAQVHPRKRTVGTRKRHTTRIQNL